MNFDETSLTSEDIKKVNLAVQLHAPLVITTYTLPRTKEKYIQDVTSEFLNKCYQKQMVEPLKFCLGELLTNSKKANTKRVYFLKKNLNINDELQYNDGMISFKEETLANINYYLEEQKKLGLYIKLMLKVDDDNVTIQIRNNSTLTKSEKRRINEKLRTAQKYNNVQEVLGKIIDQTEGAGLGIIIIILMLEKLGLSRENFKISSDDKETITSMILPVEEKFHQGIKYFNTEFACELSELPVYEPRFNELCDLLKKPDFTKQQLLEILSKDVTLTALLLQRAAAVNSECCKISQAIDIVGMDKLRSIYNHANPFVLPVKNEDLNELWEHAYNTAFFAYNLAQYYYPEALDSEEVFTAALFHDIACLCQKTVSLEQMEALKQKGLERNYSEQVFNLYKNGGGHNLGGKEIIEKFNLPAKLGIVCEYHNKPEKAPEEYKDLIYTVYLADMLQYYQDGMLDFYQFNKEVLAAMNISCEAEIKDIIEKIKQAQKA